MAGIYIHIPFCRLACHYCDFHFSTNLSQKDEMTQAILRELTMQKDFLRGEPINTIYFGGGTPSLLSHDALRSILDCIERTFHCELPEVTLEANPDDLHHDTLRSLKRAGINRLSIGIQSFQEPVLQFLNRSHTASAAIRSVQDARDAGFHNISIDLIFAIPGQPLAVWKENISRAIALSPEHISAYSLTIEPQTVFGHRERKGMLRAADEDHSATELEMLVNMLGEHGYEQYEVSNFCKPGFHSRHNSGYWRGERYLGVGPSAHSFNGEQRQFNIRNNHAYLQAIAQQRIPAEVEILSRENRINEYLLTGLRTKWGVDLATLRQTYAHDVERLYGSYLSQLEKNGMASISDDRLILTQKGKMMADRIAADLFLATG